MRRKRQRSDIARNLFFCYTVSGLLVGVNDMAARDTEKKNRVARDFRRVLIVLVIIFLAILGRQEYKIYQIQKETEATQKRVEELQKVQADLEAERKRLYDPKYIEKLAREDHNYVKKDEVPIFIVKDKEKQDEKAKSGISEEQNQGTGKESKKQQ